MSTITKSIGGDRLGSGNRMKVSMHGYGRSSHNLSRAWRSSMAPGTLVPCFLEPMLAGDTWDIDLNTMIRTLPTNGPLFGRFKLQVDFFKADVRLYNRMLHNNLNKVGLDMKNVLFPQIEVRGVQIPQEANGFREDINTVNISPDSLLAYLKIRGIGTTDKPGYKGAIKRNFNAIPMLAYWEIYMNYYANKQEEKGYVLTSHTAAAAKPVLNSAWIFQKDQKYNLLSTNNLVIEVERGDRIRFLGEGLAYYNLTLRGNNATGTPSAGTRTLAAYQLEIVKDTGSEVEVMVNQNTTIRQLIADGTVAIAGVDETRPIVVPTELKIQDFPLTNIEEIRNKIFEQPNSSPLILNDRNKQPYLANLGTWLKTPNEIAPRSTSAWTMAGLGIKTYNSDRFNNWIKTDWIDGVNGVAALTAVPIVDGKFTIDSLNLLQKVYNLMNRIALSGGTYQDWLETTTGLKLTYNPEIPVFIGGMSANIEFNEVVSTAETTTPTDEQTPLGTLAGRGYQANEKNGKIIVKAKEHGFIMGIVSITPELDYSQGNGWFNNLSNIDQLHKPELSQIGYQELITDEMAAFDTIIGENANTIKYKSAGKQTAWIQYQTAVNETYGKFALKNSEMFMTLNRQYEYNKNTGKLSDLTTYIDPVKYNYAFAQSDISAQNFWVQIGFKVTARRIMSAKAIPNL